ncbi:hypothetical protein CK203_006872 [Vitis vinifera]|uniref:Reverse transcriptase zinc-binding domain-containing protein n=1 Tax=Vitis vinifera TaxID=29760 RepID=A0A438KC60_VITVI|nr:hypothetical protein CK203_006872 [Vitis vinifera]
MASGHTKHLWVSHSNGWDANTLVRWSHRCPWKAITQVFQEFFSFTRFVVGNGERIRFWEDLCSQSYSSFLWNLNFRRNLSDSEIEDLEGLMRFISISGSPQVFPSKFVWNSQVSFKVKSFVWLFQSAKMDWVPPRSILDMMSINFNGFGSSKRGIALWQAANIALIRIVWWERNARIF